MSQKKDAIERVREARKKISEQCGNDPGKLIAYYIEKQKQHKDRLLRKSTSVSV